MNKDKVIDSLGRIDDDMLQSVETLRRRKKHLTWTKLWTMAACICLVISLSIPALAASVPAFYDILYAISPATAQFFRPVQMSCENNGIRMEVMAIYIHEDTAEIYISMQDLEASRLDETVDLFDSYQINTPHDYEGHCKLSSFDPDTQTATFLITINQRNQQRITGDKITFSVREFLSNKKTYEGPISDFSFENVDLNAATQVIHPRGFGGNDMFVEYISSKDKESLTVLRPTETLSSPVDGVSLTGIGYIDGYLHVQVYYENILKTDNHGSIDLINTETGKMLTSFGSIPFFDDATMGSYEDYIFAGVAPDELANYELYGDFTTSSGSVEGNWSITFPLVNTDHE